MVIASTDINHVQNSNSITTNFSNYNLRLFTIYESVILKIKKSIILFFKNQKIKKSKSITFGKC